MGELTLTQREQVRLQVLNGVLADQVPVGQAAEILGVSERHVWRILAAYRKEGAAALAHGNRGRSPSNAVPEQVKAQVVALASTRYRGANHTHMTELLVEREGIVLSRSTVRRALVDASIESPRRRRPPRHRVRRQRMPQEGMLVQVDGSHHDWLEDRGPRLVLLIAVDDATGNVPHALFRHEEDAQGYFFLLQGIIQHRGVPLALYSDRHAVFKHPREPRQAPATDPVRPRCKSWGYSRYSLGHRKLRAESNGLPGPSRTGWLLSYGWRAQPLSRRPTMSCGVTCPASMSSSECRRHSPPSPTVPQMFCPYSASNTAAGGITPSRTTYSRLPLRGILRGGERLDGELSAAWEQHDPYRGPIPLVLSALYMRTTGTPVFKHQRARLPNGVQGKAPSRTAHSTVRWKAVQ